MKILIFNNTIAPIGGTEINILTYSYKLLEEGHNVTFVLSDDSCPKDYLEKFHDKISYYICQEIFKSSLMNYITNFKRNIALLLDILSKEKPEVVLIHTFNQFLIPYVAKRAPTVLFIHTPAFYCPCGSRYFRRTETVCTIKPGLMRCLWHGVRQGCFYTETGNPMSFRWIIRRLLDLYWNKFIVSKSVGVIAANSTFSMREIATVFNNTSEIQVIHPPIKLPDKASFNSPGNNEVKKLLFVGRLVYFKGVDDFIRALKFLKIKFTATIVGDGPERQSLEELASREGVRNKIKFTGWLDRKLLPTLYMSHDVIVVPSKCPEFFGQVGPQAMSYGKPVVAYDVGGIKDWLIPGKTGYFARTGDIVGLANKIELCFEATDDWVQTKEVVRTRFSVDKHYQNLMGLITKSRVIFSYSSKSRKHVV